MKATVHDLSRHILRLRRILQRVLASRDRAALQLANAIDELEWQRDINQQLGAENEQKQAQIDAMRPMVEAVAKWGIGGGMPVEFYHQARAFVATHPTACKAESEGE